MKRLTKTLILNKDYLFYFILFLFLHVTLRNIIAQSSEEWLLYSSYNIGLCSGEINALATDNQGNLWIGTDQGISIFDGEKWTGINTYYNTEFKNYHINSIILDNSNNLWIGSGYNDESGGGLAKYDGQNWTFYNKSNSDLPDNFVTSLASDKNGNIWIGTFEDGLAKFDGQNWTLYNESNSDLSDDFIQCIIVDKDDKIWVGTVGGGLNTFDGNNWECYQQSNSDLSADFIVDITIDGFNNIWLATYRGGLNKFDGNNFVVFDTTNSPLDDNFIYDVATDLEDNIWIGTGSSLFKFYNQAWTIYDSTTTGINLYYGNPIFIDEKNNVWFDCNPALGKFTGQEWIEYYPGGLIGDRINYMDCDSSGNIWCITKPGDYLAICGLSKFDGQVWTLEKLLSDEIYDFAIDNENDLWLACNESGLAHYDVSEDKMTWYDSFNSDLPDYKINCVEIDHNQNIWAGTRGGGLAYFNRENWQIYNTSNSEIHSLFISDLAIDANNNKWMLMGNALQKFDDMNWIFYEIDSLYYSIVIQIDDYNNVWVGEEGGRGLGKFDGTDWQFFNLWKLGFDWHVASLKFDNIGNLWIGTWDGLIKFDGINWEYFITDNSELPYNDITTIAVDKHNNKWIGTSREGIAVYNENGVVSIPENFVNKVITGFNLSQNYPNPFNRSTTIEFTLPKSEFVELKVYNILGKEVKTLISNKLNHGNHTFTFDGKNLASGIYYYQLVAGDYQELKKMILLK